MEPPTQVNPMGKKTYSKMGAAFVARFIMSFNAISIFATFIFVILGIKVASGHPSCISLLRICQMIGYAGSTDHNERLIDVNIAGALLRSWFIFLITTVIGFPQMIAAWRMLNAICNNSDKETLLTYLSVVRNQKIQSTLIWIEALFFSACYAILYAGWFEEYRELEMLWNVVSKVLVGRIICCFIVDTYMSELWTGMEGSAAAKGVRPSALMFKLENVTLQQQLKPTKMKSWNATELVIVQV